ncbi:MAG TPA: Si-specific NAD(P)(+) transhydrogenase, partial [Chloroflexota bacterium]|nr:Si-specific NAD(P)(+) transhydrogenase [Chloroflexota bacterium]
IASVKSGRRTLMIEKRSIVGGTCINTGTIPSKSFREAVVYLSGYRERSIYGESYAVKREITMDDLNARAAYVMKCERDVIQAQAYRNGITLVYGAASFVDPHTVLIELADGYGKRTVAAETIVIATGSEVAQVGDIAFDGERILNSDTILTMSTIPRTLTVVGAGVIGCEYASMFATLGTRVTLVDARPDLLPFVDRELADELAHHLRTQWVTLWLGEEVTSCTVLPTGQVKTALASGKVIVTEKTLHAIGRHGATADLNLQAAGLEADKRGKMPVNQHYQTNVEHIYAVGDVVGFPALASTSMAQGRIAASHAAQLAVNLMPGVFPYGIYCVPELSMVGKTEEELTRANVPYEVGKAYYRHVARGQIIGDSVGMLKIIFCPRTHRLYGVHIIGEHAAELIHTGQAVMALDGTVDYFVDAVVNYPTLSELYKVAAHNGLNRAAGASADALGDLPAADSAVAAEESSVIDAEPAAVAGASKNGKRSPTGRHATESTHAE